MKTLGRAGGMGISAETTTFSSFVGQIIHIPQRRCRIGLSATGGVGGLVARVGPRQREADGRWPVWMDRVSTAARLDLCSHSLLVQFDPLSVALLVWQPFVVRQDALYQEACRLVHVDVVLGEIRKRSKRSQTENLMKQIECVFNIKRTACEKRPREKYKCTIRICKLIESACE